MASIYDKASLVLIPSGTKTSKVYSQKPVNGDGDFTFSRSTAATRVNADGNIEKETQNLLWHSNTFNTTWGTIGLNAVSGQAGYDGTNDAWKLDVTATGNYRRVYQGVTNTGVLTFSCYAKAGTTDYLLIYNNNFSPTGYFDLTNGVVASTGGNILASNIESVGGGWYRCSLTYNLSATSQFWICPSNGNGDVTADAGDYIYIQDAQLEQGLVARDYIETTTAAVEGGITDNVPRLDYTDSSCPALLLEPQRTNLYTYSEYAGIWNKTLVNVTDNYAESPEGYNNAFRAEFTSNSGILYLNGIGATGGDNTLSVWAKSNTGTDQVFRFFANGNTLNSDNFTATTEWQRFTFTYNCTNVTSGLTGNSAGGTSDILFYGFQHEEGSYATSYIPTYGSAVTRNYDLAQMLSLNNTSPAWTLFFDVNIDTCPNYNRNFLEIDISAASRRASFRWFNNATSNKIAPYFDVDAVYPFSTGVAENDTDNGKVVLRHDGNGNFSYFNFRNSVAQKRDYSGTAFTASIIDIFGAADTTELESILFFPTALSDEECETLVS